MSGRGVLAANLLWQGTCLPDARAFRRACRDVAGTQERLLRRLLARNAATAYGRRHGFDRIGSSRDYRERVPLTDYDDYVDAVARIAEGEPGVLTADPVILLERTSGSTAATKLVPYTAALKAEFGRAIAPWVADLFAADPALRRGQAYWSVTPVARRGARTSGGIPIGFEEDTGYLGRLQGRLVGSVLAVPGAVKHVEDMESFRYVTLLCLLRSRSLALISVWNPTYLTLLVGRLADWWPVLAADVARGSVTPPGPLDPDLRDRLAASARPDPRRADAIRDACRRTAAAERHAALWPRLRLVSCWTDAYAARYAGEVAASFPQARLQGKGLLATEAVVSFPLTGHDGAALAIRSHFLEFLPLEGTAGGETVLAHELERGGRYAVVITTGGGLYRYRLRDIVAVTGLVANCPTVRFLGKESRVSDRFGEKVDERHVDAALTALLARHGVAPAFAMVACEELAGAHAYTLFVEASEATDDALLATGIGLEAALGENFGYRYCRQLGQLAAVRVFRVARDGQAAYLAACQEQGQRAGDIKPVVLHHREGWGGHFKGHYLATSP